jgi:branched-chain amino acid transport system ATP-binding protein
MTRLELVNLRVQFGGLTAVDDVSFAVADDAATALIGPNGAGKTTCFNVISGLQRPSSGHVIFDGADFTRLGPHRHTGIGRTFQRIALVADMTARENVMIGLHRRTVNSFLRTALRTAAVRRSERLIRDQADELLDEFGLSEIADRPAGTLPIGHQRLVELARAQALRPRLMLLDETASGLSPTELDLVADQITRIRLGGCALLIVEHDMRFVARLAEHLVVLQYCRKIFDGTVEAGMRDEAVIGAYLGTRQTPDA